MIIENCQVFESRISYTDAFEKAVREEYTPTNFSAAMKRRITAIREESKEKHPLNVIAATKFGSRDVRWLWIEQHLDTIDGIAYFKDKVKIVPDYFDSLDKLSNIDSDKNVHLTSSEYCKLEGKEFTQEYLNERARVGEYNSPRQAIENPVWQILARDQSLLEEYICTIYPVITKNFAGFRSDLAAIGEINLSGKGMGVLLYYIHPNANPPFYEPIIQPVALSSLNHWTDLIRSQIQSDLTSRPTIQGGSRIIGIKERK